MLDYISRKDAEPAAENNVIAPGYNPYLRPVMNSEAIPVGAVFNGDVDPKQSRLQLLAMTSSGRFGRSGFQPRLSIRRFNRLLPSSR